VGDWKDAFKGRRESVLYDDHIKTPSGEHPLTPERERAVRELTERLAVVEADRSGIEAAERARGTLGPDPMAPPELPSQAPFAGEPSSSTK
jgi:hypothetical protein